MRASILSIAIFIVFLPTAWCQQQKPPDNKQKAAQNTEAQSSPSIPKNQTDSAKEAYISSEEAHRWPPPWWDPFWSNWAFVIVGFVAALVAVWTLFAIKKQSEYTKTAADAARKSAETADSALRLTQCGIVGIESASIFFEGDIKVQLKNYGPTAVRDVMVHSSLIEEEQGAVTPRPREIVGPFSIPNNAHCIVVLGKVRMTQDPSGQVSAVVDVRAALNIGYKDIFDDSHTKKFILSFDRYTMRAKTEEEATDSD